MKDKRVLVTGGAGFIGSHLVWKLVKDGASVRVLDNLSTGKLDNLNGVVGDIDLRKDDIRDADGCREACRGIDTVFHLAAYVSAPGSVEDPATADSINIGGTLSLLLAARDAGVRRFVFSSSSATYGDTDVLPTHEEVPQRPLSPYGLEKLYGEHAVRLFLTLFGMETTSLRYFNVFGPRQNPESDYAAVIPKFITRILAGQQPTIFGDGEQTRDFLYVEDIVQANILAATTDNLKGDCFNIAGGQAISLNELVRVLGDVIGSKVEPIYAPERPGDIKHSHADISKAKSVLGYKPSVDLTTGLSETVDYYKTIA